jgi:hypothetical protein
MVRNERIKLLAAALNNIGVAIVVTAIVVPSVSFMYSASWSMPSYWWLPVSSLWVAIGAGLHILALMTLGRLEQ